MLKAKAKQRAGRMGVFPFKKHISETLAQKQIKKQGRVNLTKEKWDAPWIRESVIFSL